VQPNELSSVLGAAVDGDQEAWRMLVKRHSQLVWAIARSFRLSPADAEDVSQTVWLQFARRIEHIRDAAAIGAWLATTTRRECMRLIKLRGREHLVGTGTTLESWADPNARSGDETLVRDELVRTVRTALDQLSALCQQLLRLRSIEPRPTNAEIATALDIPVGSVDYRFRRCAQDFLKIAQVER
jgi:RNA polymerase sigma factor (sigma-70 family)